MKMPSYKLQPLDSWMSGFLNEDNTAIFIFMRLAQMPDVDRLEAAITATAVIVPEILCCFNRKKNCFVYSGLSAGDVVTVADSYFIKGVIPHINLTNGPMLRISISPCAGGGCWFNMGMSHLLADGGGVKEYLKMLCHFYNHLEEADATKYNNLRNPEQLFRKFKPEKLNIPPEIKEVDKTFGRADIQMNSDGSIRFYQTNKVDLLPEELTGVKARAKKANATLNDVFLTLFHCALHQRLNKARVVLGCPIDLRAVFAQHIAADTFTVCNLTSYLHSPIEISPVSTFNSVLHAVSSIIRKQKETNASLVRLKGLYSLPARIRPWVMKTQRTPEPKVLYSNIGIIDETTVCFADNEILDCFIGGPFKELPGIRVLISTFKGKCTISSNSYGSSDNHVLITQMLEDMKNRALAWSNAGSLVNDIKIQ